MAGADPRFADRCKALLGLEAAVALMKFEVRATIQYRKSAPAMSEIGGKAEVDQGQRDFAD